MYATIKMDNDLLNGLRRSRSAEVHDTHYDLCYDYDLPALVKCCGLLQLSNGPCSAAGAACWSKSGLFDEPSFWIMGTCALLTRFSKRGAGLEGSV